MTEHPGPEGIPPAGQAERDLQAGHRMAAGDADAPLPRNAASWAAKVDRLTVADGGSRGSNVARPSDRPGPGLREDVEKDVLDRGEPEYLPTDRDRRVEGAL